MAVLDDIPGLDVRIHVNGSPLVEYDDDDSEPAPKKVTKYIEAISGARFDVQYEFKESFRAKDGIVAEVYVDGKWMTGSVFKACDVYGRHAISSRKERVGNEYYERPFTFSQLSIGRGRKAFIGKRIAHFNHRR
jgi:hypothetical protein